MRSLRLPRHSLAALPPPPPPCSPPVATPALVVAMRRASQPPSRPQPPTWASRGGGGSGRGRGGHGHRRHHVQGPPGPSRDPVGMVIPEAHMRERGISAARFDRQLEAVSRDLLGLQEDVAGVESDPVPAPSGVNLGAGFDRRFIRFQGRTGDAARLAKANTSSTETSLGAAEAAPLATMRSHHPAGGHWAESSPAPSGSVAHVRGTGNATRELNKDKDNDKGRGKGKAAPAAARTTVELDDGERVAAPADAHAALRRTARGAGGSATLERLLSAGPQPTATEEEDAGPSEAARRAQRRQRGQERAFLEHGGTRHPCPLQGGCATHANMGGPCALREYPAVCCAEHLSTGRCAAAAVGRCPWHHGDPARHGAAAMLAESLLAADGVDADRAAEVRGQLAAGAPRVAAVLQLLADLVTAAVEEAAAPCREEFLAQHGAGSTEGMIAALRACGGGHGEGAAGMLAIVTADTGEAMLAVDAGLALEAAGCGASAAPGVASTDWAGSAPQFTAEEELEAMWADAEAEERAEAGRLAHQGAEADPIHVADVAPEGIGALWTSYLGHSADGLQLRATPLLTSFVLDRAARQLSDGACPAGDIFWAATEALLSRRVRECDGYLAAVCPPHQRWAPLLLLRDLLTVQQIDLAECAAAPASHAADGEDFLFESFLATDGSEVPPRGPPEVGRSRLLDLIVAAAVALPAAAPDSTTPTAAVRADLTAAWVGLHSVLLKAGLGLLTSEPALARAAAGCGGGPQRRGTAPLAAAQRPLALASLTQAPLIGLVLDGSRAIGDRFEEPLLATAGWQPWTELQMFAPRQAAAYTPAAYARHHQPVLASGCAASLLNGLLLCAVQQAEAAHGLCDRAPLADALRGPPSAHNGDAATASAALGPWLGAHARRAHRALVPSLRSCIGVPMGFLSALRDLGLAAGAEREVLRADYRARRGAHAKDDAEHSRGLRTRKYGAASTGSGGEDGDAAAAAEELLATPPMDRVLPHGTVAVSAGATAGLMRLLLEGGAYRSLRMAVSIARVSRALRHAARAPLPRLVQSDKTVHRMHRDRRTDRKRVERVRVPTLRIVAGDGTGDAVDANEAAAAAAVELLFQIDAGVVEEVARVGLRTAPAGERLVDGVCDDCVRGHVVDYTAGRCLPVPTLADVMAFSSGYAARQLLAPDAAAGLSPVPLVLGLRGVTTGGRAAPAGQQVAPTPLLLELLAAHTPPADAARHQRYNRLFTRDPRRFATDGVLVARQCALAAAHPQWALQAKECAWAATAQRLAARPPTAATAEAKVLASVWRAQASLALADKALLDEWAAPPSALAVDRATRGGGVRRGGGSGGHSTAAPTTAAELKDLLRRQSGSGGGQSPTEEAEGQGGTGPTAAECRRQRDVARSPLLIYRPEALMAHLCTLAATDGGERRQLRVLWSACTGALLGLPAEVPCGTQHTARLARSALAQAALAAAQLDCDGPAGHGRWMERTCQLLLLSPIGGRLATAADTGTMLLSSAHTPVVRELQEFLAFQQRLLLLLSSAPAAASGDVTTPAADGSPLWLLLWALPECSPWLAHRWLEATYLHPSQQLLAWVVSRVDSRGTAGLAALLAWLDRLVAHGHEAAAPLLPVVTDLLRKSQKRELPLTGGKRRRL